MESIKLNFSKDITVLAGNQYGQSVFDQQIGDRFDGENELVVEIPEDIKLVSISFTKGFISKIEKKYGLATVVKLLKIESANNELIKKIESDMVF